MSLLKRHSAFRAKEQNLDNTDQPAVASALPEDLQSMEANPSSSADHIRSSRPEHTRYSEGHGFSRAENPTPENPRGQRFTQERDARPRALTISRGWHTITRNRALQMVLLFTVALITIGAGDTTNQFSSLGHKMVCVCGCGQILLECNHVGCPDSDRMIGELRRQVAGGGTDTSIFNWFVAKYGPTVLAAPIRGGFDNAAWIVPVVVFVLAILGTAFVIRRWKGRHMLAVPGAPALPFEGMDDVRERIRRETEY